NRRKDVSHGRGTQALKTRLVSSRKQANRPSTTPAARGNRCVRLRGSKMGMCSSGVYLVLGETGTESGGWISEKGDTVIAAAGYTCGQTATHAAGTCSTTAAIDSHDNVCPVACNDSL